VRDRQDGRQRGDHLSKTAADAGDDGLGLVGDLATLALAPEAVSVRVWQIPSGRRGPGTGLRCRRAFVWA